MQYPTPTGDHKTRSSNSFLIQITAQNSPEKASLHSSLWTEINSAHFSTLSYNSCLMFPPPRARWNKPISCPPVAKHYPDFKHMHSKKTGVFGCTSTTRSWGAFFPEQSPQGTGLQLRAMLRELEKCPKLRQHEQLKIVSDGIWSNPLLGFSKRRNSMHLRSKAFSCILRK